MPDNPSHNIDTGITDDFILFFLYCRVGIALDAYMMPVEDGIEDKIEQPLLFVNSWDWQWPKNVIKMKRHVDVGCLIDSKCVFYNNDYQLLCKSSLVLLEYPTCQLITIRYVMCYLKCT